MTFWECPTTSHREEATRLSMSSRKRSSLFLVSTATFLTAVPTSCSLWFSWKQPWGGGPAATGRHQNRQPIAINNFTQAKDPIRPENHRFYPNGTANSAGAWRREYLWRTNIARQGTRLWKLLRDIWIEANRWDLMRDIWISYGFPYLSKVVVNNPQSIVQVLGVHHERRTVETTGWRRHTMHEMYRISPHYLFHIARSLFFVFFRVNVARLHMRRVSY